MTSIVEPEITTQSLAEQEPLLPPPTVHSLDEPNQRKEMSPRKKRGRTETSSIPVEGFSSQVEA
jgi:hypothetical protein